jgi:hypothetical protein
MLTWANASPATPQRHCNRDDAAGNHHADQGAQVRVSARQVDPSQLTRRPSVCRNDLSSAEWTRRSLLRQTVDRGATAPSVEVRFLALRARSQDRS